MGNKNSYYKLKYQKRLKKAYLDHFLIFVDDDTYFDSKTGGEV